MHSNTFSLSTSALLTTNLHTAIMAYAVLLLIALSLFLAIFIYLYLKLTRSNITLATSITEAHPDGPRHVVRGKLRLDYAAACV